LGTLANISSADAIKVFEQLGWVLDRQRGSHLIMVKSGPNKSLSIPQRREMPKGTLRALIRDAGITVDDFLALL
jgi:predicted RNA binding protein YcfA (HicA-like mRNA interferase family)